jgi:hypothetical protein
VRDLVQPAWLFSRRADLLAFLGPVALAFALLLGGIALGVRTTPTWAWLGCVVLVDVAHVHSTVFRVYLDRAEVARRPFVYLGWPVILYGAGVALYRFGSALTFWRVLAYFAVWHFLRQQWGWVALYRARAREHLDADRRLDAWLDPAAVYAASLYPLIAWHARLPRRFWWFLKGDFLPGLPSFAASVARPLWFALLVGFVARQIVLAATRRRVNAGKVIVVLGTYATWWVGIVLLDSDFAFTVTNVLPHGIPYMVLVAVYARRRYGDPTAPRAPVAQLLLRGGFSIALLLLFALAFLEEGLWDRFVWHDHEHVFGEGAVLGATALSWLVPLLALPQAVHYALDGTIWKRAKNPDLARYLQ